MKKDEKVQKKDVHHTHTITPIEIVQTSSVELKRNAKGETEIRVKVYHTAIQTAMNDANRIFSALTKKYKYTQ